MHKVPHSLLHETHLVPQRIHHPSPTTRKIKSQKGCGIVLHHESKVSLVGCGNFHPRQAASRTIRRPMMHAKTKAKQRQQGRHVRSGSLSLKFSLDRKKYRFHYVSFPISGMDQVAKGYDLGLTVQPQKRT